MTSNAIARGLEAVARPFDRLSTCVVAVLMLVIAVLVFAQVVARYGFDHAFDSVQELPRISFILVVFLAMPLAYRQGMHVGMDILSWFVPRAWFPAIARFVAICTAATVVLMIYYAVRMSIRTWTQYLPSIDFPVGGFYAAIAYSSAHLLIHVARSLAEGRIEKAATMAD